jgi:hypothetical protein
MARIFSTSALAAAVTAPGFGPARAQELVAALAPADVRGMLVWITSPEGNGANESAFLAAWDAAIPAVPGIADRRDVALAVMQLLTVVGDAIVAGAPESQVTP